VVDKIGATRRLNAHRVFSLVVGFCALIGWSGFAYSTGASANVQRELRAELAQVKAGKEQLLAERHKEEAALGDLTQVQSKLAAARAELAALSPEARAGQHASGSCPSRADRVCEAAGRQTGKSIQGARGSGSGAIEQALSRSD